MMYTQHAQRQCSDLEVRLLTPGSDLHYPTCTTRGVGSRVESLCALGRVPGCT
jgi:hypothetical protein